MAFRGKCEVCSGTNFNVEDGYYYCSECNTQNNNAMEMECDAMDLTMGDETVRVRGVKLKEEKAEKVELTSWEEYNYILLGLVNEAIALGAPVTLKKIVLQLWTRYLQKINAVFFTKTDPKLPKLPANYYKQDATILYNVARKRPRSRSSAGSKTSGSGTSKSKRSVKIARTKAKKGLMKSHESLSNSNEQTLTDTTTIYGSQSNTSMSQSAQSKSGRSTIPLEFTINARRSLKRRMPKSHIKKHLDDPNLNLVCHKRNQPLKKEERIEMVSKNVLLSILYIGLNLTKSEIQLNDMRRFLREGHLSIFNVDHFFPANILQHMTRTSFINFEGRFTFPNHLYFRKLAGQMCAYLGVRDLVLPDFVSLTGRYIKELCLPGELAKFLERLITFRPPEMKCPVLGLNYEARAIAYVIFLMKWLFGLDGSSEKVMSKATKEINEYLKDENIPHEELFNFEEWMKYIEMRSIILIEYHEPTNIDMGMQGGDNTQRYLDYLIHCDRPGKKSKYAIGNHIYKIYESLSALHNDPSDDRRAKSFIFPPSMTPFRTYMEDLLNNHSHEINIPGFMTIDHSQRTIDPFLRPCRFRNRLMKSQVDLRVEVCPESKDRINVVATRKKEILRDLVKVEIVERDEDCNYKPVTIRREQCAIRRKEKPKRSIPKKVLSKERALTKAAKKTELARKAALAKIIAKVPLNSVPEEVEEVGRSILEDSGVENLEESRETSKNSAEGLEEEGREKQISRKSEDRSVLSPLITNLPSEKLPESSKRVQRDTPEVTSTRSLRKDPKKTQNSQSMDERRSKLSLLITKLPLENLPGPSETQKATPKSNRVSQSPQSLQRDEREKEKGLNSQDGLVLVPKITRLSPESFPGLFESVRKATSQSPKGSAKDFDRVSETSEDRRSKIASLRTKVTVENLPGPSEAKKAFPKPRSSQISQSSKDSAKSSRRDELERELCRSSEDGSVLVPLITRLPPETLPGPSKPVTSTQKKKKVPDNVEKFPSDIPRSPRDSQTENCSSILIDNSFSENHMDPGDEILQTPRRNLESVSMFDNMSDGDDEDSPSIASAAHQMKFFTPHFKYWHRFIAHTNQQFHLSKDDFNQLLNELPTSFTWLLRHCSNITGVEEQYIFMELLTIEKQFTCVLESVDKMKTMLVLKKPSNTDPSRYFRHIW